MTNQTTGLYRRVFILAVPMALQNLIAFSVGLADNVMVGSLGELALAGVYTSNQIQNILHMLVIGLGAAITILSSQYWGKRDTSSIKIIISIALKLSLGAGILFFTAALISPTGLLRLFTDEAPVAAEGLKYLSILRFSYIFFSITQVLIASMRSVERVKIGMYLSMMTFVVNVSLNWVLIYGNLGAPALGVRGAAIATLTARIIETIIMVIYVLKVDDRLRFKLRDLLKYDGGLFRDFFKYGSPVILGDVMWGLNLSVQGAILGRQGSVAVSAASIATTVFSIIAVVTYGSANATAVIIAKTVGSGDYELVKRYARKLQLLFLVIGAVSGLTLFLIKDYILLIYKIEPDTVVMAKQFLTVLSVTLVGTSYQMASLTGIVRAGGSTRFVLINDLIFVWLVVIPSAMIAYKIFHAPPVVVFACLKCDQILKCFVAVVKVNRFKWINNLTRTQVG
ncbi:MAG: MATE family efflux transporter [Eubacteriales bacterium]